MIKLAVFDLDGTLLNTLDDLAAACNHALDREGFPTHSPSAYKLLVGGGVRNLIKNAVPLEYRTDNAVLQRTLERFVRFYDAHGQDLTKPYEGIPQLLGNLKDRGVAVAVLSNKSHRYVPALVEHYLPGLVDYALGQQEGVPLKPDPQMLLEILERFGCSREQCAYIGDSDVDMYTGANAGVFTAGVTWGFRTKEELINAGCSVVIDKVPELQQILIDNPEKLRYTCSQDN